MAFGAFTVICSAEITFITRGLSLYVYPLVMPFIVSQSVERKLTHSAIEKSRRISFRDNDLFPEACV